MKTLIFDLDGTILDTLIDLAEAVNYALVHFNMPKVDVEHVRKSIGNGTKVLIKKCLPKNTTDEMREKVFDVFKDYYSIHCCDYTKPYPEIEEMLLKLKNDFCLIVVSNKDHPLTLKIINRYFPNIFDVIQGSYHDEPKKPHPYLISKILIENNIEREDCLYIGDTDIDLASANNVGIKYLLVNYGYRTKEELEKMCPNDTSISNVSDLYQKILVWKAL